MTFVSHELVHFRPYDTWVDLKYFAIQPEESDRTLLAQLIEHEQYHDHYAGQDPTEQSHHSVHGPYRLAAITPGVFEPVTSHAASDELRDWVASWVAAEEDGPEVEATLAAEVLPRLTGDAILRLPNLRETSEHDWGWVVGNSGFHEVVIIERAASMLTLLVASDD
jgi:hypothetical protein